LYTEDREDEREAIYLGDRAPIQFVDDPENSMYVVRGGDTLQSLADKFFPGSDNPAELWWILAEFQPTPIVDPTLRLEPGTVLVIPSPSMVNTLLHQDMAAENELGSETSAGL
jgi:hypothetical protein